MKYLFLVVSILVISIPAKSQNWITHYNGEEKLAVCSSNDDICKLAISNYGRNLSETSIFLGFTHDIGDVDFSQTKISMRFDGEDKEYKLKIYYSDDIVRKSHVTLIYFYFDWQGEGAARAELSGLDPNEVFLLPLLKEHSKVFIFLDVKYKSGKYDTLLYTLNIQGIDEAIEFVQS